MSRSALAAIVMIGVSGVAGCAVATEEELHGSLRADWGPYDPQPGHPTVADRDAFVAEVSVYAREAESLYGTPAAGLVAMASNESGFGWTKIALNANNLFGWKWKSSADAGGRPYWTLWDQPDWDPNNKYVAFADRRDAVLFVGHRLATASRYQPHTDRYIADRAAGIDVQTAVNRWVYGIAHAGYNPYEHYPTTTIDFLNNYRSPGAGYSPTYNLYRYSSAGGGGTVWVSIDSPADHQTVQGDVAIESQAGGGSVTHVRFFTRAVGADGWYSLGQADSSPYTRIWSTDPWVADGAYEIKAEAYDGETRVAAGTIEVVVDNQP